jgi:uncharacterized protein (DUF58 family)
MKALAQRWMAQRFALDGSKQLYHKDILVFIHTDGYLYVMLIVLTFVAGTNYGNNLILALCFLLFSILLLSFYLAFSQLYGLKLALELPTLGQVGQDLDLKFILSPASGSSHVYLRCHYLQHAQKIALLKTATCVHCVERPLRRGRYEFARFEVLSVYPFGIVKAFSFAYPRSELWIAPQALAVDLASDGWARSSSNQQGAENFDQLRPMQTGDALNRIAWQHYAKGKGLLVKLFEDQQQQSLTFAYQQMTAIGHEDKLSQLMYLVEQAYQQQAAFSLLLPTQRLRLGQGQQHFQRAKLLLAKEP